VELNRPWRIALGTLLVMIIGLGGWCAGRTALAYHHQTQGKRKKSNLYWEKALVFYNRAIACDPKAPAPYARIGDIYRLQSFWRVGPTRKPERTQLARKAADAYSKSLKLNPRQVEVWIGLAKAYDLAGETRQAEEAYQKAIALSPTTGYLHQELGLFYRQHGDDDKARVVLEKAHTLAWDRIAAINLEELKVRQ
jgi:tetratricopeptide (TPR) repeat protein